MGSVATLGEPGGSFALALAKSQNGMSLKGPHNERRTARSNDIMKEVRAKANLGPSQNF
jgi:hypothetical protein